MPRGVLLLDGLARLEQRPHHGNQLGAILNQLCCPHSEAVELGATNYPTKKFLSKPRIWFSRSRLIFTSNARLFSSFDGMTIEILDVDLLEPAGLHDAGDANRIVTVALIDLHLEHSLGMACINTDDRYAEPLELGPQPRGCRPAFKPNPNSIRRFGAHKCSNCLRIGFNHAFSHHGSRVAHHADRRLLQRYVQPNIVHHGRSPLLQGPMRLTSSFLES